MHRPAFNGLGADGRVCSCTRPVGGPSERQDQLGKRSGGFSCMEAEFHTLEIESSGVRRAVAQADGDQAEYSAWFRDLFRGQGAKRPPAETEIACVAGVKGLWTRR